MMGLPDGPKSFRIALESFWYNTCCDGRCLLTQPPSHVAVAITLNAKASSLKSAQRNANTAHCVCKWGPFSISVPNLKRIACFVQKLIGVPKFRNSVTWPRPRTLWVLLWSGRSRGPSSMSVPNLKRIALSVQKLLGVPKFRNWVTWP